jgi:voltage-gated potassium channel
MSWDDTKLVESLRAIPLFEHLDDLALARVAEVAKPVELTAGHVLMNAGQEGAGLLVIQEGNVAVEVGGHSIDFMPGEFFGELALLVDGLVHTGRVRATTAVRCLAIGRDDFTGLLKDEPQFAINMLRVLARRLADTDKLLAQK